MKISLVVSLLIVLTISAEGQTGSKSTRTISPRTVVVNLYNQHKKRSPFFQRKSRALLDKYFTRELATLLWEDALSAGDEVGALDGDPLFNAQEMEITEFSIAPGTVGAQAAEVPVSFKNLGQKHRIIFRLVAQRSGWKIANIEYDDGANLVDILKRDRRPPGSD